MTATTSFFTRAHTVSAVGACESALIQSIYSGEITAGHVLPSERSLALQLGVNRSTVRAALGRMEARGLVETRHGVGCRVLDFHKTGGPDLLPGVASIAARSGELVAFAADLLLMRRHLANAVLEKLATVQTHRTSGLLAAIEALEDAIDDKWGIDAIAEADMMVLLALLDLADSPALRLCFNPIVSVLAIIPPLRDAMYAEPLTNVAGWQGLVAWLATPAPRTVAAISELLASRDKATLVAIAKATS